MAKKCSMQYLLTLSASCSCICCFMPFDVEAIEQSTPDIRAKQESNTQDAMPILLVVGKRASIARAQERKSEKIEIVDSVAAEDIGKLPDYNVTDALSRITGVQILRDRGEGAGVALRGLTQMETLLNGRETFTAGAGRNIDFADIPSEMLSGIDVYKTSSANQVEGGVGGTVDLRTYRPFDFTGNKVAGSVRAIHGDLVKKTEPQLSVLASSRWNTENHGEFGLLLDASYQKRAWREDQKSAGNPTVRTDLVPGQAVVAPNGTSETTSAGRRERTAVDFSLQWRPSAGAELYAEGSYVKFDTIQNSYQINVASSPSFIAGSPQLFSGTNDLRSITWVNAPVSILSFARDTRDETKQLAFGGTWLEQSTRITADVSRTLSYNNLFFSGINLGGTAANFSQDLSGNIPSTSVTGTNLLDPASLQVTGLTYRERPYKGSQTAARIDGEYQLPGDFLDTLFAGVRYTQRQAGNAAGLVFGDVAVSSPAFGHVVPNPYNNFFPGSISIGDFLVGDLGLAHDPGAMRNAFGITAALPAAGDPLGIWHVDEETEAAYLMSSFHAMDMRLDGNAGLRAVRTREQVTGNQSMPAAGSIAPIVISSAYTDYLPSAHMRYLLGEGLYLRGAMSKTLTRQNFDQLSPSLTLVRNTVMPALNQGSAGNPELKPIRADNFDLAVERYFGDSASISLTGFYKKVDGFLTTVTSPEIHGGETYQVRRPQNSNTAHISGGELGYQQFYESLPGWLKGFGVQANYTYVDSRTPSSVLGMDVPLQNLSPRSYNLAAMYEKEKISARIAYNWRSTFLSGIETYAGVGTLPVYTKAYGWLDASLAYRINPQVTLMLEGTNLLKTIRSSYYGVETRPRSVWLNDRQLSIAMMFSL